MDGCTLHKVAEILRFLREKQGQPNRTQLTYEKTLPYCIKLTLFSKVIDTSKQMDWGKLAEIGFDSESPT